MLGVTFFCFSVLINPFGILFLVFQMPFVSFLFGKWTAALTWLRSCDTLQEEGEQGDARR
jgi:hypothetical protein